jgi:hypothetical protein
MGVSRKSILFLFSNVFHSREMIFIRKIRVRATPRRDRFAVAFSEVKVLIDIHIFSNKEKRTSFADEPALGENRNLKLQKPVPTSE